jgi:antitoxin CptB
MTIKIADLKKKIIYRSTYRGTKEMDKLLSSFVKDYIHIFNEIELTYLLDLLDVDDENLYKFNQGHKIPIEIQINKVSDLFKKYVYKNN